MFTGHSLRYSPKTPNFDPPLRHSLLGINHYGQVGILGLLLHPLRLDIDAGQPAAVPRVRVLPAEAGGPLVDLFVRGEQFEDVLVGLRTGVDACFGAFHWQLDHIRDPEGVVFDSAAQLAHHFVFTA